MGGSGSRPREIDPCPGKTRAIDDLRGQVNSLNNNLYNLNNSYNNLNAEYNSVSGQLNTSLASDAAHTQALNNLQILYNKDENVTIPSLKTERDGLIAIRNLLTTQLGQSASANLTANAHADAATNSGNFAIDANVALDLDNLNTKEKLYSGIRVQNTTLLNKFNEIQNNFTTDDQKSFYEQQQVDFINSANTVLSFVYLLFFIVLALLLFVPKNEKNLYSYKIPVLILFLIFPFVALFLIDIFISTISYLYAFVNVNAYTKDY
jgi:hypothetical protein